MVVADALALQRANCAIVMCPTRVRSQLLAAEVIVLNKADHAASLQGARAAVRAIRPEAKLIETQHGNHIRCRPAVPCPAAKPVSCRCHAGARIPHLALVPSGPFDRDRLRASAEQSAAVRAAGERISARWGPTPRRISCSSRPANGCCRRCKSTAPGLVVIGTPAMPDDTELAARFADALVHRSSDGQPDANRNGSRG